MAPQKSTLVTSSASRVADPGGSASQSVVANTTLAKPLAPTSWQAEHARVAQRRARHARVDNAVQVHHAVVMLLLLRGRFRDDAASHDRMLHVISRSGRFVSSNPGVLTST